ncbi:class I SAM-dependent methyltransferase [Flavivirga jejuensis]|uniref:Class I SAM-dependent methyltransferase n=1 Tax=Flavivirga jejuensis TaxID=870487 RepID=A0ABT8WIN3_9FLAO|nr:class I SAM-dependent methyltransferase [Flavivirga jejuensis]MDO5972980.1 class I SAM-dependent methyltransferase [Flavivirga jejuensis]
MNNIDLAKSYDNIAKKWNDEMLQSEYGLSMVDKAIQFCSSKDNALDVGCGSGGRIINKILEAKFTIKGIDISHKMLELAKAQHSNINFELADIVEWETNEKFDLIVAWDSIFHLPIKSHKPVVEKLCNLLKPDGILLFTFGDTIGEHIDTWHNEKFCYGSVGITEILNIISNSNCECKHLELDQYPSKHVSIIVKKLAETS